jgi:hypothetical protein
VIAVRSISLYGEAANPLELIHYYSTSLLVQASGSASNASMLVNRRFRLGTSDTSRRYYTPACLAHP